MRRRAIALITALLLVLCVLPAQALDMWQCTYDGHLNHGDTCRVCGRRRSLA